MWRLWIVCVLCVVSFATDALAQTSDKAWAGIEVENLSSRSSEFKEKHGLLLFPAGAVVTKVAMDGPAHGTDLQSGDLIVFANTQYIRGSRAFKNMSVG